jgi:hypothetical protein
MVDAVDSLLNNALDLYVQAIDYCQISTSQIPTPLGAGIRQIKPESGDVRQMSPNSGDTIPDSSHLARIWPERRPECRPSGQDTGRRGWIQPECRITGHLARILDGSGRLAGTLAGSGLNLARTAGPPASGRIRPLWPNPQPAGHWPGRPASGQLAGIRPFCAGFRQRSSESGKNGLIPAIFAGICICQIYIKKKLYYFILIFFILCIKFYFFKLI